MRISMFKGNTKNISINVLNQDGTPKDLTGYSGEFIVRENIADIGTPVIEVPHSAITGNTVIFEVLNSDTISVDAGNYFYEIVIFTAGDADARTLIQNRFRLLESLKY